MRVAAYQMPIGAVYGAEGVEQLASCVRDCEARRVSIVCCPEGTLGGLADYVDDPAEIALSVGDGALARALAPLARSSVTLIIGFTEAGSDGQLYNAAAVYARGEVRGVYRKRHPAIRRSRYSAGTESPLFVIDGVAFGILICRDSTDATLATGLVSQGAQVLFIPTNNAMPEDRGGPALADEARAIDRRFASELGVPVVRADVIGSLPGLVSAGASAITAANGDQLRPRGLVAGELLVGDVRTGTGAIH